MKNILIINGPNLNQVGYREPEKYGKITLEEINERIKQYVTNKDVTLKFFQSNSEGDIIDEIEKSSNINKKLVDALIINAGAYTHYSYAIRDAIVASKLPCVEVHLTNIYSREEFRCKSVMAPVCMGQISGFGLNSYILAIDALLAYFNFNNFWFYFS